MPDKQAVRNEQSPSAMGQQLVRAGKLLPNSWLLPKPNNRLPGDPSPAC